MGANGLVALLFLAAGATALAEERTLDVGDGKTVRYEVLEEPAKGGSARATALLLLEHLAAGNIREAAALSNAPEKREEVLRDYRASVGEEEFKRIFARYLGRANAIVAEVAIGPHRLIIWDLGGPEGRLAGQYYVEHEGRFLLDDLPSEARANLHRVLQVYRRDPGAAR